MEPQVQQTEANNGKKSQARARKAETGREPSEQEVAESERVRDVRERIEKMGEEASSALHRWPAFTVVVVAGLGLAAASLIGVGEVAVAGAAGYLAYRWLSRNRQRSAQEREQKEPSGQKEQNPKEG